RLWALFWPEEPRVYGFSLEAFRELRDGREGSTHPKTIQRRRIGSDAQTRSFGPDAARPDLCITKEKPLFWCKAVYHRRPWLSLQRFLICTIGQRETTEVGH